MVRYSSFSTIDLPVWRAKTDIKLSTHLPTITLTTINLSLTRFTSSTFSIHLSATNTPTPRIPFLQPVQNNLYAPNFLAPSPLHLVSWRQQKSRRPSTAIFTTSPSFPLNEPTFTDPILRGMQTLWEPLLCHIADLPLPTWVISRSADLKPGRHPSQFGIV